jgi:UDP-4-amino-4,6-dideoxy-N-acetyl-beta-L-altrosamine transaminase
VVIDVVPYARQDISDDDVQAVVDVLRSDFLTQGPAVPAFEAALAAYCSAAHAVAVNSATSALHLACLALGVGPGDWVWTSPITFVASANCALYCGARVDFVDIDPRTYCMSVECLAEKLEQAERDRRLPKAVVAVHLAGQPCDMAAIRALARRFGFTIIEDASHALGGRYRGEPIGCGRYSDITVFSFHAVKLITTGEGGMAVTNDAGLAKRLRRLRSHGITRQADEMTRESHGPWYYEQTDLGFNYRLTDIQAALGRSQLARLDRFLERRRAIARRYDDAFSAVPVVTPWQHPDSQSAWHLYILRLERATAARTHAEVFTALRAAGIGVNLHYIPVYRQPYYARRHYDPASFPEAERYYAEAMSLPMFARLSDAQQERVIAAVTEVCGS